MNPATDIANQEYQNITYQFEILSPERNVLIGSGLATFDLCTVASELFGNCGDASGAAVEVKSQQDTLQSYEAPDD